MVLEEDSGTRYELEGARVYLHMSDFDGEVVLHIDIDHPDLNEIILPKEASYVGGREGGVYIGLRTAQAERAQAFMKKMPRA